MKTPTSNLDRASLRALLAVERQRPREPFHALLLPSASEGGASGSGRSRA